MFKIMETKQCQLCGSPATYKSGEKNGKKWAGYFCQNRQECGKVDWVKLNPPKTTTGANNGTRNDSGNDLNFQQFVAEELAGINSKIDKVIRHLKIDAEDINNLEF